MRRRDVLIGAAALAGCGGMEANAPSRPLVIAHRGASGERPEHTMSAYRRAIEQGADYIEPDLVMTKDGVLVCRHENEISGTTDVAARPEFADRRRDIIGTRQNSGWWVEDFTLAELKTLRCKERMPRLRFANTAYDGEEQIPTFAEVLALARESGVGVYPELKHPSFLRDAGLDPVPAFIADVRAAGGQAVADKMFVQCFEAQLLRQLAQMSSIRWTCVQLRASSEDVPGDAVLAEIASYARAIGVEKTLIIPRDDDDRSLPPTDLVQRAHAENLKVHAWTFRAENAFLPVELRSGDADAVHGDLDAELRAFYAAGVDGVFSDFPAMAVAARS